MAALVEGGVWGELVGLGERRWVGARGEGGRRGACVSEGEEEGGQVGVGGGGGTGFGRQQRCHSLQL